MLSIHYSPVLANVANNDLGILFDDHIDHHISNELLFLGIWKCLSLNQLWPEAKTFNDRNKLFCHHFWILTVNRASGTGLAKTKQPKGDSLLLSSEIAPSINSGEVNNSLIITLALAITPCDFNRVNSLSTSSCQLILNEVNLS